MFNSRVCYSCWIVGNIFILKKDTSVLIDIKWLKESDISNPVKRSFIFICVVKQNYNCK